MGEGEIPSAGSREWRDHRDKLETARALELAFIDEYPVFDRDAVRARSKWQAQTKRSALYVDYDGGVIRRPIEFDADAATLLDPWRAKSAFLHGLMDHITHEVLRAILDHGEQMAHMAQSRIADDDPDGTVLRLRAVADAAVQDDA